MRRTRPPSSRASVAAGSSPACQRGEGAEAVDQSVGIGAGDCGAGGTVVLHGLATAVSRVDSVVRRRRGRPILFPRMFERMQPVVDGYIVVSLEETRRAMRLLAENARVISEGPGRSRSRRLSRARPVRARSSPSSPAAISI